MGRWSRKLAPAFLQFAGVQRLSTVLDVGCGTGALSQAIRELNPQTQVVGIDPSPHYVSYAQESCASPQCSFQIADARQLPFSDHGFGAALSLLVFNFVPDPGKALSELRRVVCLGGVVAAAVWEYAGGMEMLRVFWDAATKLDVSSQHLDEGQMPLCRAGELHSLWDTAGLTLVSEEVLTISMEFNTFDEFWSPFLLGQGPAGAYVNHLASTVRLRSELETMLGSGPIRLKASARAVRGIN